MPLPAIVFLALLIGGTVLVEAWRWIETLPTSAAAFLGTLTGASLGLFAILLGALYNAHLNRQRDERLRNEDRTALIAGFAAELESVDSRIGTLRETLENVHQVYRDIMDKVTGTDEPSKAISPALSARLENLRAQAAAARDREDRGQESEILRTVEVLAADTLTAWKSVLRIPEHPFYTANAGRLGLLGPRLAGVVAACYGMLALSGSFIADVQAQRMPDAFLDCAARLKEAQRVIRALRKELLRNLPEAHD